MPDSRPAPPPVHPDIATALRILAARLDAEPDTTERATMAAQLRELADRNPVALPTITTSDDTLHWRRLPDQRLRSEVYADSWNLAAGLRETRRRALVAHVAGCIAAGADPFEAVR